MQNEKWKRYSLILFLVIFSIPFSVLYGQTASITQGCSPLEVQFFAPTGSTSYFWDFKDNATSTLQEPTNTFIDPGTYVVEFSESIGGPIIGTVSITVFPKPVLDITAFPTTGCTPLNVQFESISTIDPNINVTNYSWVFGDGTTASNTTTPNRIYNTPGTYTVSLNIETNFEGCDVTQIFPNLVTVSSSPPISFTTNPNPPFSCTVPFTVSFTNSSPNPEVLSFNWDFDNGENFIGQDPDPVTYTVAGDYIVTLTGVDSLGCTTTFSRMISAGPPTASFIIPDTVCINDSLLITNTSTPGNYIWDFGPGIDELFTDIDNKKKLFFHTGGNQSISLSVTTPSNCVGDTTIVVYVDVPDASYTRDPVYACVEPLIVSFNPNSTVAVGWLWEYNESIFSTEENPTYEFYNNDVTTYSINGQLDLVTTLTVINPTGCTATFEDTVVLHEPNALMMPDRVNGCAPLTLVFSDSSTSKENIILWEWNYGDGQTADLFNSNPHEHIYTDPGEYQVQLIITNAAGCVDTSYFLTIEVGEEVAADFEVDKTEVCIGDTITFTDNTLSTDIEAFHFHTDNGRTFHCYDENSLAYAFADDTGPMDVTYTVEYNGCYSSITKEDLIQVNGPVAKIDYLVDCTTPFDISFRDSSIDASSISWDFGDNNSSNLSDLVHSYDSTGTYWVKLTAEDNINGCPSTIDSTQIYVKDIKSSFELDSLLCANAPYIIDAASSEDVEASCWRGYSWYFSFNRPIATQENSLEISFPPGNQSITLVTRDINGCKDTSTLDVTAYESTSNFEMDDNRICLPAEVSFTDLTIGDTSIVDWEWSFGDGAIDVSQNPIHTYLDTLNVDSLNIELVATDAIGCKDTIEQTIHLYEPVSFISTAPFPTLCIGEEIQFSASDYTLEGSSLNFMWNLGNGQIDTTQTTSTIYPQAGNYEVILNYEEIGSACQNSTTLEVMVQDFPEASFSSSLDTMDIICYPQNAQFTSMSTSNFPLSHQWNFGNGQMAFLPNPSASFGKGVFEVVLVSSTSFGCRDTVSAIYSLVGPEGDFTFAPDNICKGDFINFNLVDTADVNSFTWDFGDGVVEDNVNPTSHQYNFIPPSGQTVATLILKSEDDACTIPIEKTIFMHEAIADFTVNDGLDTTSCINENVFFMNNSSGADSFSWLFGDNNNSNANSPQNIYTNPGEYQVSLFVENSQFGCLDTLIKTLVVFPLPNTVAIGDTICQDNAAILNISNPSSTSNYVWSPNNLIAINNTASPTTESLNNSVSFTVQETDIHGCQNSSQSNVLVVESFPGIEWDTLICEATDIFLPVTGSDLYNFNWEPQIPNCENCSFPLLSNVQEDVSYSLTVTDALGQGCPETISSFDIAVVKSGIEIPNIFTPNSDQANDYFNIVLPDGIAPEAVISEFKIWNRWGELVYNNENPSTGWDGFQKGKKAPSDVYVYSIKINIFGCTMSEQVGDVTLVR